ncbi:MAG: hypothetical protein IH840_08575 [Candidatus Heimdallarchaeota archaeon]|nr:hypothetical protein [Candidatus Heimdallarchaeota archaeon]
MALTYDRPNQNAELYVLKRKTEQFTDTIEGIGHFNTNLHRFIDFIDQGSNFKGPNFEVLPFEVYFEDEATANHILIQTNDSVNIQSSIILANLSNHSADYMRLKSNIIQRKVVRMKLPELTRSRITDYDEWIENRLHQEGVQDDFQLYKSHLKYRDEQVGPGEGEIQFEEDPVIVSQKISELNQKEKLEVKVKDIIWEFLTQSIANYVKLDMITDLKMKHFHAPERRQEIIKESKDAIENLISKYNLRRLVNPIGLKLIEIVKTIDAYLVRDLHEGLYKLKSIEELLTKSTNEELNFLLKEFTKND